MPTLYTVPAGLSIARHSAAHLLATLKDTLSDAVILVPTRRSASTMRRAFQKELDGKAALLPRILPLADVDAALVSLLGDKAFALLESIPPAMPEHQHRYLLTAQIQAFERKRMGGVSLHYALTLADTLMRLQEQCARAHVELTHDKLRQLLGTSATHAEQAILFLGILTEAWPEMETETGYTLAAKREVALLSALASYWQTTPPTYPVIAIGSTASQPATAQLLVTIADMEQGQVILPGLDPTMDVDEWASITPGHPLFHVKALLDHWPLSPSSVTPLASFRRSLWEDVMAATERLPNWSKGPTPHASNIKLIPCVHAEEEARVISLLLRETLETAEKQVALITPDEGLMARVASHLQRYGILADRLNAGTLANTETGSLWLALLSTISDPSRQLSLRSFLHHPLLGIDSTLLNGLENGWHGVSRHRAGNLPRHAPELREHASYAELIQLVRSIASLSRQRMDASHWIANCRTLLATATQGQGAEAIEEALAALRYADAFGTHTADEFLDLLTERLSAPWRDAGINTHPRIAMLTPVEARLEQFDRVILANMQESIWPGLPQPNPWLNRAARESLRLPSDEEGTSRMAHDVLMLASSGEVFLTYPLRDAGSPTTRSRFIERLITLLATHAIPASTLAANEYITWANALGSSDSYEPATAPEPRPTSEQRPRRLPATDIDTLFTDPFTLYAKHVLNLRKLKDIDAAPEASDFGSLAHKAIESLTQHWNAEHRPATREELHTIAAHALQDFSERPNIDLFWRTRLINGLSYVNTLETERRPTLSAVAAEHIIEQPFALANGEAITLHGRIDRLEQREGRTTIIDHKTGEPPSSKKILEGRALQLLVYAMLLNHAGSTAEAIEYWALPKLGEEGDVHHLGTASIDIATIETKLAAALTQMLDSATPFLAQPHGETAFSNDYNGISRYDEWAG